MLRYKAVDIKFGRSSGVIQSCIVVYVFLPLKTFPSYENIRGFLENIANKDA